MTRRVGLLIVAWVAGAASTATAQRADSLARAKPLFSKQDALWWGGAVATAALADLAVRDFAREHRSKASNEAAAVGNSLGTVQVWAPILAGTWLAGTAAGESSVARAATWAAASAAVAGGITVLAKAAFGRKRPRDGDAASFHPFTSHASFPSGHTSFAFAIASSLAHATKDGWSDVGLYSVAAFAGWSRINSDRHWVSDVVGGAALGFFVGRQLTVGRHRAVPVVTPVSAGVAVTF